MIFMPKPTTRPKQAPIPSEGTKIPADCRKLHSHSIQELSQLTRKLEAKSDDGQADFDEQRGTKSPDDTAHILDMRFAERIASPRLTLCKHLVVSTDVAENSHPQRARFRPCASMGS